MTARRPARITGGIHATAIQVSEDDDDFAGFDPFGGNTHVQSRRASVPTSPSKSILTRTIRSIHPSLTDYGPDSASLYFREQLQKLKADGDEIKAERSVSPGEEKTDKGKKKADRPGLDARPRRQAVHRASRKSHRTVIEDPFDDDDDDDDAEEEQKDVKKIERMPLADFPDKKLGSSENEDNIHRSKPVRRESKRSQRDGKRVLKRPFGSPALSAPLSRQSSDGLSSMVNMQLSHTLSDDEELNMSSPTKKRKNNPRADFESFIDDSSDGSSNASIYRCSGCGGKRICLCDLHEDSGPTLTRPDAAASTRPAVGSPLSSQSTTVERRIRRPSRQAKLGSADEGNGEGPSQMSRSSDVAPTPHTTEQSAAGARRFLPTTRIGLSGSSSPSRNRMWSSPQVRSYGDTSDPSMLPTRRRPQPFLPSHWEAEIRTRRKLRPVASDYPLALDADPSLSEQVIDAIDVAQDDNSVLDDTMDWDNITTEAQLPDLSDSTNKPLHRVRGDSQTLWQGIMTRRRDESSIDARLAGDRPRRRIFGGVQDSTHDLDDLFPLPPLSNTGENNRARPAEPEDPSSSSSEDDSLPKPRKSQRRPDACAPPPPYRTLWSASKFNYEAVRPEQLRAKSLRPLRRSNKKSKQPSMPKRRGGAIAASNPLSMLPRDVISKINQYAASDDVPSRSPDCELWDLSPVRSPPNGPPYCPLGENSKGWPPGLPVDILIIITQYLSHPDVLNLRLVNKYLRAALVPIVFRNVVTRFGKSMFDIQNGNWDRKAPTGSIFEKYGMEMSKFGISFEVDLPGMQSARQKVIQHEQQSWWGDYKWPVPVYPRFRSLQLLENLADHLPFLKSAFGNLKNVLELGLCVDSGHGWLNGPDQSDMQTWNQRCSKGPKVFGRTFEMDDVWQEHGRNELFKWAQVNTINHTLKSLRADTDNEDASAEMRFLRSVAIRNYESFVSARQPDTDQDMHTGGTQVGFQLPAIPAQGNAQQFQAHLQQFQAWFAQHQMNGNAGGPGPNAPMPQIAPQIMQQLQAAAGAPVPNLLAGGAAALPVFQIGAHGHGLQHNMVGRIRRAAAAQMSPRRRVSAPKRNEITQPQWPIIFSGHNLAAEVGGHCASIQEKVANPKTYPFHPGHLTEPQAQWLMETVWAQRAFLSAYTTAILTNKAIFKHVHSVHIAKLSSGLLPSLEQREFWQSLPNLRNLKILISPDWRTEHSAGDQAYQNNMLIPPVTASMKFAEFLLRYVARIEQLSSLSIGFVGGGEHAAGMLARNAHVLPAPITFEPRNWLDRIKNPNPGTMLTFNHIKQLTFENCWLSPYMLETFMSRSKDTSLRQLTLDSVSLTGPNTSRTDGPTLSFEAALQPQYSPSAWLNEQLLYNYCWAGLIDQMSPGITFSERKYAAGLLDPIQTPPEERKFRGNVEKLVFKSCGYVKISGVQQSEFNQNAVVVPCVNPRDHGLSAREALLREHQIGGTHLTEDNNNNNNDNNRNASSNPHTASVMMRERDAQGHEWFGLGRLTECVSAIEKRILEQAWDMTFGWGGNVERFHAVEDGCFEGGTGRFSGVVTKG